MPIISSIGRRAWNLRIIIYGIYAVLSLGAVTMVYPFTMMVSLAVSSDADYKENQLVPRYFYSEDALYRKFLNIKYIEMEMFNKRHHSAFGDFSYGGQFKAISSAGVNFPRMVAVRFDLTDERIAARINDYNEWKGAFIQDHWAYTEVLYDTGRAKATINPLLDAYMDFLLTRYGSIEGINAAYFEENREDSDIFAIRERSTYRTYLPAKGLKYDDWREFKRQMAQRDLEYINLGDVENEWGLMLTSLYGSVERFNERFGAGYTCIYAIPLSFTVPPVGTTDAEKELREAWITFARNNCPLRFMTIREPQARYREFLQAKYGTIKQLNTFWQASFASFEEIVFPSDIDYNEAETADIYAFIAGDAIPPEDITIKGPRGMWGDYLKEKYGTLDELNRAHSITYGEWEEVSLARRLPIDKTAVEQADWKKFVVESCPVEHLLGNFSAKTLQQHLRSEYREIDALNSAWGTSYERFESIKVPAAASLGPQQQSDLRLMLETQAVPLALITIPEGVPDSIYRDFLMARYASIEDYNHAVRIYPSWDLIERPIDELEWEDFQAQRDSLKWDFLVGNFRAVANYMAIRGRAFINTIILCAAMIIASLTVNPLCAYALSRFQLSFANSILLFLLATMAFPLAVTQIPNFLLLKDARLLNTYWALILPSLANGYSIFLLKGFFDSLPQELFEAGLIDGASEVQMFYRIALPLTAPILAVIALGAFTLAYGQFMWAFIVCQNPKYWTIMVFLYQYQGDRATHLVMAGLVLASLPTLLVFIAAQKVILKGIVIPQMK